MNKTKVVKILFIIMMLNVLISNFNYASSTIGNEYTIKYQKNESRYISYNEISQRFFDYYYIDDSNNKMDVYCINLGQNGAEKVEGGYSVKAVEYIKDKNVANIISNGYPYKSYEQLGLKNKDQAKFATQFALWIYTNNLDISKIKELNSESNIVKNAIINIYNSKNIENVLETNVNFEEKERKIIEYNEKDFYKVKFYLTLGKDITALQYLNNIEDIRVVDNNLNDIDNLIYSNEFYILYPVEKVSSNITYDLKFKVIHKNNKALFGKPSDSNMQDVALILPSYEEKEELVSIDFKYQKLELRLIKKDNFNNYLQGVKFNIYEASTNNFLGNFTTDENGYIFLDFRKDLNINDDIQIKIVEIETKEDYELLDSPIEIKLTYNECKDVEVVNYKKEIKIQEKKVELPKTGM